MDLSSWVFLWTNKWWNKSLKLFLWGYFIPPLPCGRTLFFSKLRSPTRGPAHYSSCSYPSSFGWRSWMLYQGSVGATALSLLITTGNTGTSPLYFSSFLCTFFHAYQSLLLLLINHYIRLIRDHHCDSLYLEVPNDVTSVILNHPFWPWDRCSCILFQQLVYGISCMPCLLASVFCWIDSGASLHSLPQGSCLCSRPHTLSIFA